MKRLAGFLSLVLVASALAQDVPPPPRPADDAPSLVDTMQFIQEKLASIGPANYVAYRHDSVTGADSTFKFTFVATNVQASSTACSVNSHLRATRDDKVIQDGDFTILLKNIQDVVVETREQHMKQIDTTGGHPEWTARVDPPVFVVLLRAKTGASFFYLFDESLANRIANAMVHAVELCGGGNRDPF